MFAETTRESAYVAYRARLEALLGIPPEASDQDIHELVNTGFPAALVETLCSSVQLEPMTRNQIISLRTLRGRLARDERLTVSESDRLFRLAHVIAMAETCFGCARKSHRWLSKPKNRFDGKSPYSMLSTAQGTRIVELALTQLAEGLAF